MFQIIYFLTILIFGNSQSCIVDYDHHFDLGFYKACCNGSVHNAVYYENEFFETLKCYVHVGKLILTQTSKKIDFDNNYDKLYVDYLKVPQDLITYRPDIFTNIGLFTQKPKFIIIVNEEVNQDFVDEVERYYNIRVQGFNFPCVSKFIIDSNVDFYRIVNFKVFINNKKFIISDATTIFLV